MGCKMAQTGVPGSYRTAWGLRQVSAGRNKPHKLNQIMNVHERKPIEGTENDRFLPLICADEG